MPDVRASLFTDAQHVRDLAPNMAASELLQRIITTADDALSDNQPAAGSVRGCAITLAARLQDAVSALVYIEQRYGRLDGVGWDRVLP